MTPLFFMKLCVIFLFVNYVTCIIGVVACKIIVSAPVPVPFLWTLDLGFGTWIWDLDLGLDLGLTIKTPLVLFVCCKMFL